MTSAARRLQMLGGWVSRIGQTSKTVADSLVKSYTVPDGMRG